jgi:hypothetical protein
MIYGRLCGYCSINSSRWVLMSSAEDHKPREIPAGRPFIPRPDAPSTASRPVNRNSGNNQPIYRGAQQHLRLDPMISMKSIDRHINKAPSLDSQKMSPTPTLLTSTPTPIDWAKMPPSPPLTAASSMSTAVMDHWSIPKFFNPFTEDVITPRTFFVACQNSREVEVSITVREEQEPSPDRESS